MKSAAMLEKIFFAHYASYMIVNSTAYHISFLFHWFSVRYRFLFPNVRFLYLYHLALLKDQFLFEKMFLKRAKIKYCFYLNWKQFQIFKIAVFEFKETIHCVLWEKAPSCIPLKKLEEMKQRKASVKINTQINIFFLITISSCECKKVATDILAKLFFIVNRNHI